MLELADAMPAESSALAETLRQLAAKGRGLTCERYPKPLSGVVLTTRRRVATGDLFLPAMDDGEDETSRIARREPISLTDHTAHVCQTLDAVLSLLPVAACEQALRAAARFHDLGKADERFQALLLDGDLVVAWAQTTLWAKSAQLPRTPEQRLAAFRRSTLPAGFRHEMLATQLAELAPDLPADDPVLRELALHLVASHHGQARPFAPVVLDEAPPDVTLPDIGITLTSQQRSQFPPHRLDSGVTERFWALTRHLGWWGLAYLEAVLRLADQRASQREDDTVDTASNGPPQTQEATP